MASVRDVVTDALREIGVLAAGEVATADDALGGLEALNRLTDQWAAERLNIYTITRTAFAVAANTRDYNVGLGATVNVARPIYIDRVAYSSSAVSPAMELPLVPLGSAQWAALAQKTLTGEYPTHYHWEPTYPAGTLSLWPVPTSALLTAYLYAPQQVAEFASLDTAIALPPGYRRMIVKNLALELAPSYEKTPGPDLRQQAANATGVVKRANRPELLLEFEYGGSGCGAFDIRTG
jgi:hypothetical protein